MEKITVRTNKIVRTLEYIGIFLKIICKGSMEPINRNSLIIATTLHRSAQYSAQTEKKCSQLCYICILEMWYSDNWISGYMDIQVSLADQVSN